MRTVTHSRRTWPCSALWLGQPAVCLSQSSPYSTDQREDRVMLLANLYFLSQELVSTFWCSWPHLLSQKTAKIRPAFTTSTVALITVLPETSRCDAMSLCSIRTRRQEVDRLCSHSKFGINTHSSQNCETDKTSRQTWPCSALTTACPESGVTEQLAPLAIVWIPLAVSQTWERLTEAASISKPDWIKPLQKFCW